MSKQYAETRMSLAAEGGDFFMAWPSNISTRSMRQVSALGVAVLDGWVAELTRRDQQRAQDADREYLSWFAPSNAPPFDSQGGEKA